MKNINSPDYKMIYLDIIRKKHPDKEKKCGSILKKINLSAIDIIRLNDLIFGIKDKEVEAFNQNHRSYSKSDILKILDYQKRHKLNNSELSRHFRLSRNTISKWRRIFLPHP